jgi:ketosteroid isomerase-like protein
LDKALGRLAKTTATVSGDKSLEAGGRTTQRMGERKTYVVTTHADGGWKVQAEGASRAKGVAVNNAEDWREGKLCASW